MEKALYKKVKTKACPGPGGMKCPCCTCRGTRASIKTRNNRILRKSKTMKEIYDDSRAG